MLLNKLWDSESYVDDNTLSVNTTRVRKKLQTLHIEGAIETIRSVGYRLHITWDTGIEKMIRLFIRDHIPLICFYYNSTTSYISRILV